MTYEDSAELNNLIKRILNVEKNNNMIEEIRQDIVKKHNYGDRAKFILNKVH